MAEGGVQFSLTPESPRGLARQVPRTIAHMLTAIRIRDWHFGVEIEVSEARIERVAVLRSDGEHSLNHRMGIICATCLFGTSLGNIKADIHLEKPLRCTRH